MAWINPILDGAQMAWMVQEQAVLAVCKRFGAPDAEPQSLQLLTDNGSAYTAHNTKRLLKMLGIQDCKAAICSLQSNRMQKALLKH